MNYLFGFTKYFRSGDSTKDDEPEQEEESDMDEMDINDDLINNKNDIDIQNDSNNDNKNDNENNDPINIENKQNEDDEDEQDEDDEDEKKYESEEEEDESEDDLLGGPFETLEEEIDFLREQNNKLKEKVKFHKSQRKILKRSLSSQEIVQMKINGRLLNVKKPHCNISLDELSEKVQARLPKFLQKADQSTRNDTIYIPSDVENEIGIIDIKTVDWWDMVQFDKVDTNDALAAFTNDDENLQYESTQALGGPFIVLREQDVIDAIACFVAQCVISVPECRDLDHEKMMEMINGTFAELKEKGPLGKMLDWGNFIYLSYGWTTTAYTVYSNAYLAKTLLSCFVTAAWVIGVL